MSRGHVGRMVVLVGLLGLAVAQQCTTVNTKSCTATCNKVHYDLSLATASATSSYLTVTDGSTGSSYYVQLSGGGLPSSLPLCGGSQIAAGSGVVMALPGGCQTIGIISQSSWQLTSGNMGSTSPLVEVTLPSGGQYSAKVEFVCVPSATVSEISFAGNNNNEMTFSINTKWACPGTLPKPAAHNSGVTSTPQTGWILIGLTLGGFAAYMVGGAVYNAKKHGAEGIDRIPHRDFWTSLPGLVKDGFAFSRGKVTGRGGASYDAI